MDKTSWAPNQPKPTTFEPSNTCRLNHSSGSLAKSSKNEFEVPGPPAKCSKKMPESRGNEFEVSGARQKLAYRPIHLRLPGPVQKLLIEGQGPRAIHWKPQDPEQVFLDVGA